jgi:hypothetical protein
MGHLQGSTLGFATPTTLPQSGISWGFTPYSGQQPGIPSFAQQYGQQFSGQPGYGSVSAQPLQQILQFLHTVPQQLQQLQILQQQQLGHVQQLLQLIPAQLQQLQQLIQSGQPTQFLPQQQPFAAAMGSPFTGPGANYVM